MQKKEKSLAKNAVFNIAYRILNVLFPLVSAAYVSRVLGPSGVGKVADVQNIVSYFILFAMLGIPNYGTREIAKCRNNPPAVQKLFSELFLLNGISTTILSAAFYAALAFGVSDSPLLYLVCGIEILFNYINIDWFYEGEEEYVYITVRSVLIKLLSLVMLFLFVKQPQDYPVYALIHCLGIGGNNIFNIIHARKKVKLTVRGLNMKQHLKPVAVLAFSAIIGSIYSKLNVTILGRLATDESVGFYSNAWKAITIGSTLVTAISAVFMPRLSYTFRHCREQFEELISIGTKIILFLALPACIGIALVADDLVVALFGAEFQPAALSLQIMSVTVLIMGVGNLLCYQMVISSGSEKLLIKPRIAAGIANVAINLLLIPKMQHLGAAIATVASELLINGLILRHALKLAKPKLGRRYLLSLLVSAAAMAAAVLAVRGSFEDPLLSLMLSVGTGVVVYLVAVVLTKNEVVRNFLTMLKGKKQLTESGA